jgi:hypothetical protein
MQTSETKWGKFQPLPKPVDFIANVKGDELTATLLGLVNDPILNVFRVEFSDGYVDDFIMSESGVLGAHKGESAAAYASAIQKDMDCLCLLSPKDDFFNFRFELDGKVGNVWVLKAERDEQTVYRVYTEGDYHFHLMQKAGQWEPVNSRVINPRSFDKKLVNEVIGRLELQEASEPIYEINR